MSTRSTALATSDGASAHLVVDRLLDAVRSGTGGDVAALHAPGAVLDATVPNWRLTRRGPDAVAAQYALWFRHAGRFEELERTSAPGCEVVRYVLAWEEDGVPHAAHQCHWLTFEEGSGLIVRDRLFCGGRWSAPLIAKIAAAGPEH